MYCWVLNSCKSHTKIIIRIPPLLVLVWKEKGTLLSLIVEWMNVFWMEKAQEHLWSKKPSIRHWKRITKNDQIYNYISHGRRCSFPIWLYDMVPWPQEILLIDLWFDWRINKGFTFCPQQYIVLGWLKEVLRQLDEHKPGSPNACYGFIVWFSVCAVWTSMALWRSQAAVVTSTSILTARLGR